MSGKGLLNLMKKKSFYIILLFIFSQSCNLNKNIATLKFDAHITFSNVDYPLSESYGSNLSLKIKFPQEYYSIDNMKFSERELEMKEYGSVSTEFLDEIKIKSDSSCRVPFQWIISDYSKEEYIINDSLFIFRNDEWTGYLWFDISKVQIAESKGNKNGNDVYHHIWIKNEFRYYSSYKAD